MIDMKNPFYVLLLIGMLLWTCKSIEYKALSSEELAAAFVFEPSSNFKGYYYKGSDTSYHYFVSKWSFQKDRYFKVFRSAFTVVNPIPFSKKGPMQHVEPNRAGMEEFGRTAYFILYVVK